LARPTDLDSIRALVNSAVGSTPYDAFPKLWVSLLKLALPEQGDDEFGRVNQLVRRLPISKAKEILGMREVSSLLALEPPLEKILSDQHERLAFLEVQRAIKTIRTKADRSPQTALAALCFLLKTIRNKSEHGFKTPDGPRDQEILAAASPLVAAIVSECLAVRGEMALVVSKVSSGDGA
jgi:hypothetical protein